MTFIDANIFLRAMIEPASDADRIKASACRALFEQVCDGDQEVTTSEAILAEVVYVLVSPRLYALPRHEIVSRLKPIIALPGFEFAGKATVDRALDLFATYSRLDFEDALSDAVVERSGSPTLYSYDRDFDKVPGITRMEPELLTDE